MMRWKKQHGSRFIINAMAAADTSASASASVSNLGARFCTVVHKNKKQQKGEEKEEEKQKQGKEEKGLGLDPWQEERKWRLTPSVVGNAIGLRRGQPAALWVQKIGLVEPFIGNEGTAWNNSHRLQALSTYQNLTGNKISMSPCFHLHKQYDWLGASPRAVLVSENGMVEVKCPYTSSMHPAAEEESEEAWNSFPVFYMPRIQILMEILGKDWMDLYIWFPKASSLFRVYKDDECCELLLEAVGDFWLNHVVPAKNIVEFGESSSSSRSSELVRYRPLPRHTLFRSIWDKCSSLVKDSRLLVKDFHQTHDALKHPSPES